jgi:hypothetical protein
MNNEQPELSDAAYVLRDSLCSSSGPARSVAAVFTFSVPENGAPRCIRSTLLGTMGRFWHAATWTLLLAAGVGTILDSATEFIHNGTNN